MNLGGLNRPVELEVILRRQVYKERVLQVTS